MICPHCNKETNTRYFSEGVGECENCHIIIQYEYNPKPEIKLPGLNRLHSEFIKDLSEELKKTNDLFFRPDSKEIVEIGKIVLDNEKEITGFVSMKPARFITCLEKHVVPVLSVKNKKTDEWELKSKSISNDLAGITLSSEILQTALPKINRIFTTQIPIIYKGELTFPCKGYDKRFNSWLPTNAPEIINPEMSLEEAKETLKKIYQGFCFETTQDYHNAISALLTPFLRGLYPRFNARTPVWFYIANRERAGKDYCAGITGLVYEGTNLEESPICNGEKNGGTSEELRKKFMAALLAGRKRMHFSNNKGYIDNAVFESIVTAEKYTDRILGRSENADFENEIEFSLSGNVGVTFTPDFANRCRFIRLFLDIENANERQFDIPDLHGYILENRGLILSALYALVRNWIEKGKPGGTKPFASFYNWANVCGGIMESAGYMNPCEIDKELRTVAGDYETQEMKLLFECCYKQYGDNSITKSAMISVIKEEGLFDWLDLENNKGHQTQFGLLLKKFIGRLLSEIRLTVNNPTARPSRWEFKFSKGDKINTLVDFS